MKALDRSIPGLFHGCYVRVRLCVCVMCLPMWDPGPCMCCMPACVKQLCL